jgi:hypothetical protein
MRLSRKCLEGLCILAVLLSAGAIYLTAGGPTSGNPGVMGAQVLLALGLAGFVPARRTSTHVVVDRADRGGAVTQAMTSARIHVTWAMRLWVLDSNAAITFLVALAGSTLAEAATCCRGRARLAFTRPSS